MKELISCSTRLKETHEWHEFIANRWLHAYFFPETLGEFWAQIVLF